MLNDKLVEKIASSKKYARVYDKTVARIVADCLKKYEKKQVIKKAKNILHQSWGAFNSQPNFKELFESIDKTENPKQTALSLLKLQSSTNERIPILDDFYKKIFDITGLPKTIIDIGSGLNPLTFFWMNLSKNAQYYAFDIDKDQAWFLKSFFNLFKVKQVKASLGDALIDDFPKSDITFFLKVIPLLERQEKGVALKILKKQNSKFLVVSFPTKSISGKQKGMIDFYSKQFQDLIKDQPWKTKRLLFESELVFIIKKHA